MTYVKPEILAQNSEQGCYAAGCPTNIGHSGTCNTSCFIAM